MELQKKAQDTQRTMESLSAIKAEDSISEQTLTYLASLYDPMPFGIIIHHSTGILFANKKACNILQTDLDTIQGKFFISFITPSAANDAKDLFKNAFKSGKSSSLREIRIPQKKTESKIVDVTLFRLPWDGRGTPLVQVILEDNTEQLKKESQLMQLSSLDPLTGAQNRRSFVEYYNSLCNRFKGEEYGLILFDLDHFKKVNDTYGHDGGDMALQITVVCSEAVLARKAIVLDVDQQRPMLARVGGEEFAILMPHCGIEETIKTAEDIRQEIEKQQILTARHSFQIAASVGVTVRRLIEGDIDQAMQEADAALYKAKEQGRNRVIVAEADQKNPPDDTRVSRAQERPNLSD